MDPSSKQSVVTSLGDMVTRMTEACLGRRCIPILIIVDADKEDGHGTTVHMATSLPLELTQEVINSLHKETPGEPPAPGEATAEDLKAEDGDLSDVRPGEVGGVTS